MKTAILTTFLSIAIFITATAQVNNKPRKSLLVAPSKLKLLATNVVYQGEECSPYKGAELRSEWSKPIVIGDNVYYEAHPFYRIGRDGLAVENFGAKTCRVYRMSGLAEVAGWFKRNEKSPVQAKTLGLFKVGNTLWMGSHGIGVAVFDLERKTWSRFDLKSSFHDNFVDVRYADDNYAFVSGGEPSGASYSIYSVKQNKWLELKAVSTKLIHEYGNNFGGMDSIPASVPVDHSIFAHAAYMPMNEGFWSVRPSGNGESYLFETRFSEKSKTVFEISKSQLEQVFKKSSR